MRSISRECDESTASVSKELLEARRYVEHHYTDAIRLEDLAEIACLSVSHFCAEYKKHFNTTAIEYAIRLRFAEALHLMADANLSITQIADRVGYDDIYYFSRLFKKRFGVSPRKKRQELFPE